MPCHTSLGSDYTFCPPEDWTTSGRVTFVNIPKQNIQMMISNRNLLLSGIFFVLFVAACTSGPQEVGILEGHVTIGPLVPVVQEGVPEPTPAPEVYAARQIVVLQERDSKEVARFKIDAEGNYSGELPEGTYVVDINHLGIDFAKGFPKIIDIVAHQVTHVDVDIDTGIR